MKELKRFYYLNLIRPYFSTDGIKIISGIRGCGKTVLIHQIIEELKGSLGKDQIIYMNFEQSKAETDFILNSGNPKKTFKYIFLDEMPNTTEFIENLKRFQSSNPCSVFITSSTKKDFSSLQTTNHNIKEFLIHPFSYLEAKEFIALNEINFKGSFLDNYLRWGGFPQRFSDLEEKATVRTLERIYHLITERDVFKRDSPKEKYKFNSITSLVLGNSGKDFKANFIKDFCNFNKTIDRRINERKTIYNYLEKMENAYLVSDVRRYNIAERKPMSSIPKQYAEDNGLRSIKTNTMNSGPEFFLKNTVYSELIRQGYIVFTGKTYKGQIDFTVFQGTKKCFIQVCGKMEEANKISEVFDSFRPIRDASPKYVISLDRFDYSHDGIIYINLEDFLLGRKVLTLF